MADGDDRRYRDAEWLREQYQERGRSTNDIADECGCAGTTVLRWLDKHGIETRTTGAWQTPDHRLKDEEWLREQYQDRGRTVAKIAEVCGCGSTAVGQWLEKHGIETRKRGETPDKVQYRDEEWLREQYQEMDKSIIDIAEECGCANSIVSSWLEKHGIETRPRGGQTPDDRLRDGGWLRDQYQERGLSTSDIADKCGCGSTTVRRWLKNHDIEIQGSNPEVDVRIKDAVWLREQYQERGRSTVDIAKELGCHDKTVWRWLNNHDIETRPPDYMISDDRLKDEGWLREQYHECGRSTIDIAEECGCHPSTVGKWLEKHDIKTRTGRAPPGEDHPHWSGGVFPYGPGWNAKKRQQVRRRDGRRCVRCDIPQSDHLEEHGEKLHVHHIKPAREFDDPEKRNATENLITLCRDCHQQYESFAGTLRPEFEVA